MSDRPNHPDIPAPSHAADTMTIRMTCTLKANVLTGTVQAPYYATGEEIALHLRRLCLQRIEQDWEIVWDWDPTALPPAHRGGLLLDQSPEPRALPAPDEPVPTPDGEE